MKENKSTPDWLKNAKESIEEFENSRYGKMSAAKLAKVYAGQISSQTEAGKKQTQEFIDAAKKWKEDNPEKVQEIAKRVAATNREKGVYDRNAELWRERRMQETPEERSALSRYANSFMTKEKRAQIGESKKVTEEAKRIKRYQEVYDTIEETDWFTPDVVLEKYQFKGTRKHTKDKVISISMMGNILSDKRFYDSKIEKFSYRREDGKWVNSRKLWFKKKQNPQIDI